MSRRKSTGGRHLHPGLRDGSGKLKRPHLRHAETGVIMPRTKTTAPNWPKGKSGNPGGRTACRALTLPLRQLLDAPLDDEHPLAPLLNHAVKDEQLREYQGRTPGQIIAMVAITQAILGDHNAREFVANRAEGRVPTTLDLGDSDNPVLIAIDAARNTLLRNGLDLASYSDEQLRAIEDFATVIDAAPTSRHNGTASAAPGGVEAEGKG